MRRALAKLVVTEFWRRMATNDFSSVAPLLASGFTLEYPQSQERIRGGEAFVRLNQDYPAHGPWRFVINRLVGDDREAVTDVSVTDGVVNARVLSFFTIEAGKIARMVEYWPEPFAAPAQRAHLVEPM
jgi:hypothetical protein